MSDDAETSPPSAFPAARLWERRGREGQLFLSGTMAGVRVLIVRNANAADADDAQWVMLFGPNFNDAPRQRKRS